MYGKKETRRHPNWIQRFSTAALLVIAPAGTAILGDISSLSAADPGAIPNAPSAADTSGSSPMLSSLLGNFSKDRAAVRNRMKAMKNKVSEQMSGLGDFNPLKRNQQQGDGAGMIPGTDPRQQAAYPPGQYPQGQYAQSQYQQSPYQQGQSGMAQYAAAPNQQSSRSTLVSSRSKTQPSMTQSSAASTSAASRSIKMKPSASASSPSSQMASNQQTYQSSLLPQNEQQYQMMKSLQEQYPQGQFQIVANPDNPQEQIIVVQNPQEVYPSMVQQEMSDSLMPTQTMPEMPAQSMAPSAVSSQSLSPQSVPVPSFDSPVAVASKPVQQKRTPVVAAEPISAEKPSVGKKKTASKENEGGGLMLDSLISDLSMKRGRLAKKSSPAASKKADIEAEAVPESIEETENASVKVEEPVPLAMKQDPGDTPAAETEIAENSNLLLVPNLMIDQTASGNNTDSANSTNNTEVAETEKAASEDTAAETDNDILYQMPVIEINATGAKRIMVGQESEYQLRIKNSSSVPANALVVTTIIPAGIDITTLQPTVGTSRIVDLTPSAPSIETSSLVLADGPHADNWNADALDSDALNSGTGSDKTSECVWKVGTLGAGEEETLQLKFIPRVRNNIDFVSDYEYEKTSIKSGIEVQEPVLELAIDGNDTIDWGVENKYRMVVRNTGNGEAQNLTLTVATGDSDSATRTIEKLAPGEEKTMEINIKTVLDGQMKIKIDAAADYGFTASAEKTIEILRGKLDLFVEAPEMQFVNDTVDYLVHIGNTGTSALSNVEVAAAIPTNVEYVSCSGDGKLDSEKNRVLWTIPTIKPDEELVYQVTGKMLRSGSSRFDVTAADKTGISAFSDATITVDAIAALEMKINKPSGPVAIGSEVEYEVVISNSGTKAAEEISAGFLLNDGLIPVSVDGGGKVVDDGTRVVFNKVSFLGPGQSVVYKVRAKAERAGNLKVQAVLNSAPDEIQLVAEEMSHFYTRKTISRRSSTSAESTPAREMVAMKPEAEKTGNNQTLPQVVVPAPLESTSEIPTNLPGPKF